MLILIGCNTGCNYTLAMGYLATGEIFENMLQLKRFGLYFEGIMNRKCYFHIEIMKSATEMLRGSGACSPRQILK